MAVVVELEFIFATRTHQTGSNEFMDLLLVIRLCLFFKLQVEEVLNLHLVDELGQEVQSVPPAPHVGRVVWRSVLKLVVKSQRVHLEAAPDGLLDHL